MKPLKEELAEVESWACCDWPARAIRAQYKISDLERSLDWYKRRLDAIQEWQSSIPAPYREECCDIIANGQVAPCRVRQASQADGAILPGM